MFAWHVSNPMLCVGLTGGIGCGKSTAAEHFAALGAAVLDADQIAHELTAPNGVALPAIRAAFGNAMFATSGALDRAALRREIFSNPVAKRALEAILHPMIEREIRGRLMTIVAPYTVIVVPLLLETGSYNDIVDRVLVIDCDENDQIHRTGERSRLSSAEIRQVMSQQLNRAARLEQADDVIANVGDIAALHRAVDRQHARYIALATAHEP